ncbi:MAG TPA: phosphoadenosine phosphosulfate reductase [Candidatus Desulfofervidus auxilii]|uniref:Phosphoadenosine phosphosulfate reductase n=1 Tax=Desulfofervidus auxilii TaxID=1621989 RepID=A0A7C0Y4Q6_DESA2|nr:phosphoadenosine phosphosulfate reductase [Candidatus Desulfofervidus auxilii]
MSKIAVAISGGKDSTATLLKAIEEYGKNVIGIFVDTGFESSITYNYINYLQETLDIQIFKIRSKKYKDLPNLIKVKKKFPFIKYRFCTILLKVMPIIEFLSQQKQITEIWSGIRLEESKSRKIKYKHFLPNIVYNYSEYLKITAKSVNKNLKQSVKHIGCKFPILYWKEVDVFNYIKKKKVKINPLYSKGFTRVGCYPCILAKKIEFELCWLDPEGKRNILLLASIEKELNEKGFHTKLKPHISAQQMVEYLRKKEIQRSLF